MASEELKTVRELLSGADLGGLTLQERRAFMASAGPPPPVGTVVDPVEGTGRPASPASPASPARAGFAGA